MRRLTTDNLRLLAFHEAGHAVAAWALIREAPEVALVAYDPGMTAGRMQVAHFILDAAPRHNTHADMPDHIHEAAPTDGEPTQFRRDDFEEDERRIIILMAGVEAEAILTHDEDWWESEEDRKRAEDIITALLANGWLPAPQDEHERGLLLAHEDMARRCWAVCQYRTRNLMRQPPLQSAVIALADALLAEERIDSARTARIIRTGIAEADPDLLG
ncbi:MAG TPA: hypothetical protein VH349_17480 [Ktedonobacterales bacterium]|jgi:hypothetical protein